MELLTYAAETYSMVRQFPAARKLYDRALDIIPNDPDLMARKAAIYQAEGNLQEAAKLLAKVNAQTPSRTAFGSKINQLHLNGISARPCDGCEPYQAQFHFDDESDKGSYQTWLAFTQRLAGDAAGAKVTAEQARNTLEPLNRDQPDNPGVVESLSCAYAAMGEKTQHSRQRSVQSRLCPVPKIGWPDRLRRAPGGNSDDGRREQPCDLNSHPAVTNAIFGRVLLPSAHYAGLLRLIPSGILYVAIRLSRNFARKSSRECGPLS